MITLVKHTFMNTYTYIIIDDSEIDRLTTSAFLNSILFLESKGSFSNAFTALEFLKTTKVDVIFLDIDVPAMTGIEMVKKLNDDFIFIFITSHPEYALEGFELEALDFLVKPINKLRFEHCLRRLEDYLKIRYKSKLFDISYGDSMLLIKDGTTKVKVDLTDIMYLEALKDYTRIITKDKKFIIRGTIGNVLEKSNFDKFIRIHKSFAIQRIYVHSVKSDMVFINEKHNLPVGRKYKENLVLLM